jgi:hypothetical protein
MMLEQVGCPSMNAAADFDPGVSPRYKTTADDDSQPIRKLVGRVRYFIQF